jgi:hypothetical protein
VKAIATEQLRSLLERRPFTVLGYSAEHSVWCPVCLRLAAGLSPARGADYDGKPILPLYARDEALREEACDNCGKPLVDLLLGRDEVRATPPPVSATLHAYGECWALSFDGVPPAQVRSQLKQARWRWDARFRLWWCTTAKPELPAGLAPPQARAPRPEITARPPLRRRPRVSAC